MTAVIEFIVPVLAGISILAALFFAFRGLQFRVRSTQVAYGVAQQEARQAMQVDFVRGIAAAFVGMILFGVIGLSPGPTEDEPVMPDPSPTSLALTSEPTTVDAPTALPTPTNTPLPPPVATIVQPTAEPTSTSPVATETSQPEPTDTPAPEGTTATVSSEVGVWLRDAPSVEGEQLEWILDGTILTLLDGTETVDEFEWQQVLTPDGNEGWVAVPFILYNQ